MVYKVGEVFDSVYIQSCGRPDNSVDQRTQIFERLFVLNCFCEEQRVLFEDLEVPHDNIAALHMIEDVDTVGCLVDCALVVHIWGGEVLVHNILSFLEFVDFSVPLNLDLVKGFLAPKLSNVLLG